MVAGANGSIRTNAEGMLAEKEREPRSKKGWPGLLWRQGATRERARGRREKDRKRKT